MKNHSQPVKNCFVGCTPKRLCSTGKLSASVALLLHDSQSELEIFLIQRAYKKNDQWSGQIAFPGGIYEPQDDSLLTTAKRETKEEVGLNLDKAKNIGQLDDLLSRNRYKEAPVIVSCYVFMLDEKLKTDHNDEVADSFWCGLGQIQDSSRAFNYHTSFSSIPYPAIRLLQGRILWGLTYRFVQQFLQVIKG